MVRVYVSIGSNVERERNIRAAIHALRQRFGDIALSRVYQTKAEGFAGDDFLNLVAALDTADSVEQVRDTLAEIETAHGRVRGTKQDGPRTLDIDILLYGDLIRHEGRFDIPRREILKYAFVLGPLAELAPEARYPETGERLADLWQRFEPKIALREVELNLGTSAPP